MRSETVADCIDVTDALPRRFLKFDDVAEILSTSTAQVYAFVERSYTQTQTWIEAHPFTGDNTHADNTDAEIDEAEWRG